MCSLLNKSEKNPRSFDLADYISEEEKTFDIIITLKLANKYIISGKIEFRLTSIMFEDGVPAKVFYDLCIILL